MSIYIPNFSTSKFRHAFVTRNFVGRSEVFKKHKDKSDFTLNICLERSLDCVGSTVKFFAPFDGIKNQNLKIQILKVFQEQNPQRTKLWCMNMCTNWGMQFFTVVQSGIKLRQFWREPVNLSLFGMINKYLCRYSKNGKNTLIW